MNPKPDDSADKIQRRAQRLQHAREHPATSPLRGFSTFGMIGWSVATPTVIGALVGLWLNKHFPGDLSWPVALILGGIAVGCFIAWSWVVREERNADSSETNNS